MGVGGNDQKRTSPQTSVSRARSRILNSVAARETSEARALKTHIRDESVPMSSTEILYSLWCFRLVRLALFPDLVTTKSVAIRTSEIGLN